MKKRSFRAGMLVAVSLSDVTIDADELNALNAAIAAKKTGDYVVSVTTKDGVTLKITVTLTDSGTKDQSTDNGNGKNAGSTTTVIRSSSTKTGDKAPIGLYVSLGLMSILFVGFIVFLSKRKREED